MNTLPNESSRDGSLELDLHRGSQLPVAYPACPSLTTICCLECPTHILSPFLSSISTALVFPILDFLQWNPRPSRQRLGTF